MPAPVPEYLSPLRWRWILFVTRRDEVRFIYWPPSQATGFRRIRMFHRRGYDIGTLVWTVCDTCRCGSINQISIAPEYQRRGLGRRLILRAIADGPSYRWQTTAQSSDAKRFFPILENETGIRFPEHGSACEHLTHRGSQPVPSRRRRRPVLQRNL